MNTKLFFSALLFSTVLLSCNKTSEQGVILDTTLSNPETKQQVPEDTDGDKQKMPSGNFTLTQDSATPSSLQTASYIDWDKKIIKTATVKLEVKDFKKYNESVHGIVRKFGGYVAQEEQNLTDEKTESVVSVKVPVLQFEPMLNELSAGDVKVFERSITSQDVTGDIVDTRSRLEAKKQVRLKYIDFLKASKNMEDILKVQEEINKIQEDIEAATGRVAYLSNQSAYSTINLTFYQAINGFKPTGTNPSFLTRVSNSFKSGAEFIIDLLVALVSIWPLLLITLGAIAFFKGRNL